MSFSRRNFLQTSASSLTLGSLASFGFGSMAFANSSLDDDASDLQNLTRQAGSIARGLSQSLTAQIKLDYANSKNNLFSSVLCEEGDRISHPKNSLMSWYYNSKDEADFPETTSQFDLNAIVFTERDSRYNFVSLAAVKRNDEKLELLGKVTVDDLLNDAQFPLPQVNCDQDTLTFHSAIANFSENDSFTFVLCSIRFFVCMAFDLNGKPRVLFYLDRFDEEKNTFDVSYPQYKMISEFRFSRPVLNITNDGKYSIYFHSYNHGILLFNMEQDGLKLVSVISDGTDYESSNELLSFPKDNYSWKVRFQPEGETYTDSVIQTLHNIGPNKETLMHWHLSDGTHAFTAFHKNSSGQYELYPRALLKPNVPLKDGSHWFFQSNDEVSTAVSPSHSDAEDLLTVTNHSKGCAFLKLNYLPEENYYQVQLLKNFSVDEPFHTRTDLAFTLFDKFTNENHVLTPSKRERNALLYAISKKEHAHLLLKEDNTVMYRVHLQSPTKNAVYSVDFYKKSDAPRLNLLSAANSAPETTLSFFGATSPIATRMLGSSDDNDAFSPRAPEQTVTGAQNCGRDFWHKLHDKYIPNTIKGNINDPYDVFFENQKVVFLDIVNKISKVYEDHYHVSKAWQKVFKDTIMKEATDWSNYLHNQKQQDDDKKEMTKMNNANQLKFAAIFGAQGGLGMAFAVGAYYGAAETAYNWKNSTVIAGLMDKYFNRSSPTSLISEAQTLLDNAGVVGSGTEILNNSQQNTLKTFIKSLEADQGLASITGLQTRITNLDAAVLASALTAHDTNPFLVRMDLAAKAACTSLTADSQTAQSLITGAKRCGYATAVLGCLLALSCVTGLVMYAGGFFDSKD